MNSNRITRNDMEMLVELSKNIIDDCDVEHKEHREYEKTILFCVDLFINYDAYYLPILNGANLFIMDRWGQLYSKKNIEQTNWEPITIENPIIFSFYRELNLRNNISFHHIFNQ